MKVPAKILLFDVDSVLVEPLGYRAALLATLKHFTDSFGINKSHLPSEDTIEYFEAMHITSEWDMAPIILALLLDRLVSTYGNPALPSSLEQLRRSSESFDIPDIDYRKGIDYLSKNLDKGEYPATIALRISGPHRTKAGDLHPGIFPHISQSKLVIGLLSDTRDPYKCPVTRIFQQHTLGSQVFSQVYGLEPDIETTSKLMTCDRPLLEDKIRDMLVSKYSERELGIAAITNRPSYPPKEVNEEFKGYPPEAEMAMKLNGLDTVPLIGFGRLRYVAEQENQDIEGLLKPSPVHILSAIFAAITGQEFNSIQKAVSLVDEIDSTGNLSSQSEMYLALSKFPEKIQMHVYEDTRWGIDAAINAGIILNTAGVSNQVYNWGIATSQQKITALENVGAKVFPNISDALRYSVF